MPTSLAELQTELSEHFPAYQFSIVRRLTGKCVLARETRMYGAEIYLRSNRIIIEAAIPDWKTRLLLGAGAAVKKMSDPRFNHCAEQVASFLSTRYDVKIRQ
jgi:hypothetical protein